MINIVFQWPSVLKEDQEGKIIRSVRVDVSCSYMVFRLLFLLIFLERLLGPQ